MKATPLLLLTASLFVPSSDASAAKYEICLWPRSCAPTRRIDPILKKDQTAQPIKKEQTLKRAPAGTQKAPQKIEHNALYTGSDPLSQTILQGSVSNHDNGIVSAIRDKKGITYKTRGSLSLPATTVPALTDKPIGTAGTELAALKTQGKASSQINTMRKTSRIKHASKPQADKMFGERKTK